MTRPSPPRRLHAAVAALLLAACSDPTSPAPAVPGADALNVLLVTLDTTRADRIGCYGHAAARTPAIDSLARDGVRFDDAFCQVPLTLPSHASLLTGTFPAENGIRINGGGVLGEDTPTLASAFREKGYRTAAFVSVIVLHRSFGLDRGFEVYDSVLGDQGLRSTGRTRSVRPANETTDSALAWLDEVGTQAFFAWVHYFDPHLPLNPPPPFDTQLEDPYDGEIAFVDSQIARLLAHLDARGLRERTLVVVTSDHGEALGEHGEDEHGLFLYSATTRVPLVLRAPGRLPAGRVVEDPVSLVSLAPTLLDVLGWSSELRPSGESFAPAWSAPDWTPPPTYCETEYPRLGYGWAPLRALVQGDWLYVDAPEPELYDRSRDRGETDNLVAEHSDVAASLAAELERLEAAMEPRSVGAHELSASERAALESLGYVNTSSGGASNETGRNPRDMVEVSNGYLQALHQMRSASYAEAAANLERLVARSPESDAIHGTLGNAYMKLGRPQDAAREFRLSLRSNPRDAANLGGLGEACLLTGELDEARTAYGLAVEEDPEFGQAHSRLGMLAARAGDMAGARRHFEEFARIEPTSTSALVNLANVQMQQGEFDAAIGRLRAALDVDPACAQAHEALWACVRIGRLPRASAIEELRGAVRAQPGNPELGARLAWALASDASADAAALGEALELARASVLAAPDDWRTRDALAAALAASGDFAGAIREATAALQLAQRSAPPAVAPVRAHLEQYSAQRRFTE